MHSALKALAKKHTALHKDMSTQGVAHTKELGSVPGAFDDYRRTEYFSKFLDPESGRLKRSEIINLLTQQGILQKS